MVGIDTAIEVKTKTALGIVSRFAHVVSAFLFGSQAQGTADKWSDIDLAVFVEGLDSWDVHDRARISVHVQKEAGDDIEVHFLPAHTLIERDPAGFAAWVLSHGVEIQI